jgi:hypothetical protein
MAVSIVSFEKVSSDRGVLIIESDDPNPSAAQEELRAPDARHLALAEAASKGLSTPGVEGAPEIYRAATDGTPLQDAYTAAAKKNKGPETVKPGAWRARVRVQGKPL